MFKLLYLLECEIYDLNEESIYAQTLSPFDDTKIMELVVEKSKVIEYTRIPFFRYQKFDWVILESGSEARSYFKFYEDPDSHLNQMSVEDKVKLIMCNQGGKKNEEKK